MDAFLHCISTAVLHLILIYLTYTETCHWLCLAAASIKCEYDDDQFIVSTYITFRGFILLFKDLNTWQRRIVLCGFSKNIMFIYFNFLLRKSGAIYLKMKKRVNLMELSANILRFQNKIIE